jgi:hypothetical protein
MTKLGRPVQREDQLRVHGLLGPQRAVIVEHRDTVPLRDEVRRVRIGHRGDELHDRLLGSRLTPIRQLNAVHDPPPAVDVDRGHDRLITRSVGSSPCGPLTPSG